MQENSRFVGGELFETGESVIKRITVIRFGVHNRGGNDSGYFGIEVRMDGTSEVDEYNNSWIWKETRYTNY